VAAAAALVNVATPGQRRGRPYAVPSGPLLEGALTDAVRSGSRRASAPTAAEVPALVELGIACRPVFELAGAGRYDVAAAAANALLETYRPAPRLERHDDEPWHLHFHGRADADRSGWGGGISVGLATVLGSAYPDRLGVCGAPACDRVFVDVSRNGTRRFCSTACQNRVKTATHRARQASTPRSD
jgi:predicted RNA-binding Zn ribbon-like protein